VRKTYLEESIERLLNHKEFQGIDIDEKLVAQFLIDVAETAGQPIKNVDDRFKITASREIVVQTGNDLFEHAAILADEGELNQMTVAFAYYCVDLAGGFKPGTFAFTEWDLHRAERNGMINGANIYYARAIAAAESGQPNQQNVTLTHAYVAEAGGFETPGLIFDAKKLKKVERRGLANQAQGYFKKALEAHQCGRAEEESAAFHSASVLIMKAAGIDPPLLGYTQIKQAGKSKTIPVVKALDVESIQLRVPEFWEAALRNVGIDLGQWNVLNAARPEVFPKGARPHLPRNESLN
jgi:hypothetical protein